MFRLRLDEPADRSQPDGNDDPPGRLPLRWAVISSLSIAAAAAGLAAGLPGSGELRAGRDVQDGHVAR
jgi:hypothetical protein